jgi:hypothetical protein
MIKLLIILAVIIVSVVVFVLWRIPVFKKITIHLASPICTCEEQNIQWTLPIDKNKATQLALECKTCGVVLLIPNKKFVAGFQFDKPYPGKSNEEKPKTDGNVIPFPSK